MKKLKKKNSVVYVQDAVRSGKSKYNTQERLHNEIIVNLSLIENIDKSFYLENCDHDAHLKRLKSQREQISIPDVINKEDKYVIINGIPGVGKTTLVNSLLYQWSCGEIWNGEDGRPKFDFVFVLYCRELNKYMKRIEINAEKMLIDQYNEIFQIIRLNDLCSVKEHVLLVIEGFDEYAYIDKFRETNHESYCQSMYDILNPDNAVFPFQKLVTGRPLACSLLSETFCDQVNLKHLEVTGFTVENRDKYIANFCGHDLKLKVSIGNRIKETETINTMTFIPVFCWAVCSLFRDDKNIEAPKTHTALYAYLLLVFLRNHGGTEKKLVEILNDPNIKICLKLLSKMAYLSLKNGKIVYKEEDFQEWDVEDLEHTFHISGLITKIEGGDLDECSYQFTHLSLHEFLAAIYIYYNYDVPIDFMELLNHSYQFRYVVPYIAGLEGGRLNNSKSQKIVQLYSQLWKRE